MHHVKCTSERKYIALCCFQLQFISHGNKGALIRIYASFASSVTKLAQVNILVCISMKLLIHQLYCKIFSNFISVYQQFALVKLPYSAASHDIVCRKISIDLSCIVAQHNSIDHLYCRIIKLNLAFFPFQFSLQYQVLKSYRTQICM